MYNEISDFFVNRSNQDPLTKLFQQEAVRIQNNFAEVGTLSDYKKSKAFHALQKRQTSVVTRLNTIKQNFTKKREQITLLAVKPTESNEVVPKVNEILNHLRQTKE